MGENPQASGGRALKCYWKKFTAEQKKNWNKILWNKNWQYKTLEGGGAQALGGGDPQLSMQKVLNIIKFAE